MNIIVIRVFLLHRLIFSQDGRQRAAGIWSFTIPDIFDRVCITGICTGSYSALALTPPLDDVVVRATRSNTTDTYKGYASSFGITLTSPTVLSVNYYDDYAFIGSNGIDSGIAAYDAQAGFDARYTVSAKTFLTGTLTAQLLPNGTVSSTYLYSVMYYDYKGRVIQTKGNNPLSGGTEKEYIAYNFTGQPLQKKHIHAATGKDTQTELYTYTYDDALRLKTTQYSLNGAARLMLASNTFNIAYAYDKQGNMISLNRNGTLTKDLNKGINSITYNLLNLPQTLTISNPLGSATNSYTYAADGRKLKTVIGSKTKDYCGNVIYENGVFKRILIEGGYIEGGTYYFYLTDHLGNNRVVADVSGNIKQTNHYYPFGMSFAEGIQTSPQPYKYNGKELDTDRGLNLYDYSARYMDPALGRFSTVDSLVEKYYSISPYAYV